MSEGLKPAADLPCIKLARVRARPPALALDPVSTRDNAHEKEVVLADEAPKRKYTNQQPKISESTRSADGHNHLLLDTPAPAQPTYTCPDP